MTTLFVQVTLPLMATFIGYAVWAVSYHRGKRLEDRFKTIEHRLDTLEVIKWH